MFSRYKKPAKPQPKGGSPVAALDGAPIEEGIITRRQNLRPRQWRNPLSLSNLKTR